MEKDCGVDFLQVSTRHANDAAYVRTLTLARRTDSHDVLDGLMAHAIAQEKAARAVVIAWKPCSNIEAQFKLLYVVQYLIAMRTSLDDREMDDIMNSISHLRAADRV
jgi:hypothetical protein